MLEPGGSPAPLRLLLVEDDNDDAFLVESILRRDGLQPLTDRVDSLEELTQRLTTVSYDLVISDFTLPRFTAFEAIAAVRAFDADLPLIVVSGTIGEEKAVETMRLGANDYLMKGKLQRLGAAVRRELADAESRRHRRVAEAKLRESERLMAQAQALARMGHFAWNREPSSVTLSDQLRRIYGVDDAFVPTLDSWMALVHEEDRERAQHAIAAAWETGRGELSVRIVTPAAEERVVDIRADVETSPHGEVRMLGVVKDVTERFRLDRERRQLQQELELILASTLQAIIATDEQGRCTIMNAAAETLTGFTRAELTGQQLFDMLPQPGPHGSIRTKDQCPIHVVLETARPVQTTDVLFRRKDGSTTWVDVSASPMFDGTRLKGAVALLSDITERRLMRAELERAERLTSLGRTAAAIAHEFNNVLMGIQPFSEAIRRRTDDPAILSCVDKIQRSVQRGRGVTHEILTFTRPAEPEREIVMVAALLENVREELIALLPESIALAVGAPESLAIDADPQQITQVLMNLALNARDAMPSGGTLEIGAMACAAGETYPFGVVPESQRFAHVTVRDTGSGISPDAMKQLFDPFFTTRRGGTGLGLPIAHRIIEVHRGHIFVESEVGKGTVFHLFLPLPAGGGSDGVK